MREFPRAYGESVMTLRDVAICKISMTYEENNLHPALSLALGRRYAARSAEDAMEYMIKVHMPTKALDDFEKIYAVGGTGFRLGSQVRDHAQVVLHPSQLPVDEGWVALSGGEHVLLGACSPSTTEYFEAHLATRQSQNGIRHLADFLNFEGAMLAAGDGEKVFQVSQRHYIYPENMFSAMENQIRSEYLPERRSVSYPSRPIRRGKLVLVR